MLIKLRQVAEQLGKSISDIARETGINRNTVTSLYHGKSSGVQFSTLEKICQTYGLRPGDLFEYIADSRGEKENMLYKQEGEAVLFTLFQPLVHFSSKNNYFSKIGSDHIDLFVREGYCEWFFSQEQMNSVARHVYDVFTDGGTFDEVWGRYIAACEHMQVLYDRLNRQTLSRQEILSQHTEIRDAYDKFWAHSIFIDTFDAGVDQDLIKEIQSNHALSDDEVEILLTPEELTFTQERELALHNIVAELVQHSKQKVGDSNLDSFLHDFDYVRSNYGTVLHASAEEVQREIRDMLNDVDAQGERVVELETYSQRVTERKNEILAGHNLSENPVWFFSAMTYWREHRKQYNLKGFHCLDTILESVEQEVGISKKDLAYALPQEVPLILSGALERSVLEKRRDEGAFVVLTGAEDFQVFTGGLASSIRNDLEERFNGQGASDIISGRVASQGYAKGVAKVILDQRDFHLFDEGDILITGMTRPEFVPIMKKAAAIVTNEGGITCHAAIVSRELRKPCIIGTQHATAKIESGDLVEVRANHGTVRVLSKKR